MWRWLLLVLVFVGGTSLAKENNEDIFEKLCYIAGNVSVLMKKDGEAKSTLDKALYGDEEGTRFKEDGTFTADGCGLGHIMRNQLCSHMPGGYPPLGGSDRHGCFADSLFGTFLCLCTKGSNREQDLCGLSNLGGVGSWTSWRGDDHEQNLFKAVWGGVKQKCFKNNTVDMETLKSAVEGIKGKGQQQNGKYYATLGVTNTNGICTGTNPGDACVTYPADSGEPKIPWADKILKAIEKLNKTHNQAKSIYSATTDFQHQDDHDDHSDDPEDSNNDDHGEEEEVEESGENPGSHNASNPSRPKKKRSKKPSNKSTKKTREALKDILHKNDGSFLPQPFWLLSAFVV
ncbi:Variant surface glycoprotein [Trypanosoma congolense IL3000]|uniref:Variant surface glycoprotein n=1 Tax=Trypanosoma congolense (strain IL3000) TaxID=1068625 RepID=F9W3I7_TRYCI|nr:Variant surface glycoprotein [Trypanosoma congolense IL3000]